MIETNLRFAGLPYLKRLADFDFAFQPSIDQTLIEELATGRFLAEDRNVLLLGPPGVGKTHLAIALGIITASTSSPPWNWPASSALPSLKTASATARQFIETSVSGCSGPSLAFLSRRVSSCSGRA